MRQQQQAPGAGDKIVAKFGGTSLADAGQVRKVAAIVRADPRRRHIVVSAPGKRHARDQKVTDLLLTCWHLAAQRLDYQEPLCLIRERYAEIARDLGVSPIEEPLAELAGELEKLAAEEAGTLATRDWVAARGEYFHASLIAEFLGADFVPAGECVRFNREGRLDPVSYTLLAERTSGEGLYVIPGFYGRDAQGRIKTFSRGGSDVTGAVVARAVGALVYENWTDVPGLLMADPRVVENPPPIAEVTYRELRELAYMGASVLHEEAVFPVREAGIPIHVRSTNAPEEPGTRIVRKRAETPDRPVVGIAGRSGFTAITIEKWQMNQEVGFGHKALGVFLAHGISFEHMPSAIDSLSIIVSDEELEGQEKSVLDDLRRVLEPSRLERYTGLSLIATVGEGMAYRVGVAAKVFGALAAAGVNIRMISQGASEISILIGVAAADYERAVRAIYTAFSPAPRAAEQP